MFLGKKKGTQKLWKVLGMSVILIVVMVSHVSAYVQTHEIVHTKYVQFFVYQLYPNKAVFKKEGKEKRE